MVNPRAMDITFTHEVLNPLADTMGGITDKLRTIANGEAYKNFGDNAVVDPSDMEISVEIGTSAPIVVGTAWHEVGSGDKRGMMQRNAIVADIVLDNEDGVLDVDGDHYLLTTREYFLLMTLAHIAAAQLIPKIE